MRYGGHNRQPSGTTGSALLLLFWLFCCSLAVADSETTLLPLEEPGTEILCQDDPADPDESIFFLPAPPPATAVTPPQPLRPDQRSQPHERQARTPQSARAPPLS